MTTDLTTDERDELEKAFAQTLKRFDKIGFGRHGVLDAEQSIVEWYRRLAAPQQRGVRELVLSLLDRETAATASSPLNYNTPEMVQALAITLCGALPIRESLPKLHAFTQSGVFRSADESSCAEALQGALAQLEKP